MKPAFFGEDTIVAPATPPGVSALAIVRLSGKDSINIVSKVFKGKDLTAQPSHTAHFGRIYDGKEMLDEVLVTVFKAPTSYTGENMVEISTHGSPLIVKKMMELIIRTGGRSAEPGEFTRRAFVNGKFDLAQAEAIADLIHAEADLAHKAAVSQLRGGFSDEIKNLRQQLVDFASLLELELDFSEEDVEFANRGQLRSLLHQLHIMVSRLRDSFVWGNVVKNGILTVIAGKPNAGKSTLLNALLNEEKAIVSSIPGTTRDYIEDEISFGGLTFRFVDTAGLREAQDEIESIGVRRSHEQIARADLVIYLFDAATTDLSHVASEIQGLRTKNRIVVPVANKADLVDQKTASGLIDTFGALTISAKNKENLDQLKGRLLQMVEKTSLNQPDIVVTNSRHFESLSHTAKALKSVLKGLDESLTTDLLALELRRAIYHLGEITGEITNDEMLGNIFGRFCIGK